mgnify:CR=1 FL=1
MSKTKGRVTLPSESGFLNETKELMERWGADAIRDSDGTKLDKDVKSLDAEIYTILWQEDTMNLQLSIWRNASSSTLCPGVLQQWETIWRWTLWKDILASRWYRTVTMTLRSGGRSWTAPQARQSPPPGGS